MRIVALSDQHGFLPDIPPCDLLIVGGDICPDRIGSALASRHPEQQKRWFDANVRPWLAASPARHKIATWGNHDWCGEACDFSRDAPGRASTEDLQIVVDRATRVPGGDGARRITVWATPWSNLFMDWAFMKAPADIAEVYAAIPNGVDILVSHQPAFGYGDTFHQPSGEVHLGSHELLAAIDRVRPRLVLCGHFHAGYGRYDRHGIPIYNVSVVDEQYRLVNPATVIEFST